MIFDAIFEKKCNKKKTNIFKDILLNQYGNYTIFTIINKAVQHPNKKYIDYFLKVFRENTESLKKLNYGKKFINKVDQLL